MDTEKIRKIREKLGLTQDEAARKAGLKNRQFWSNIESGNRVNIKIETLERIARVLKVAPGELLKPTA